jgi:Fic family protein
LEGICTNNGSTSSGPRDLTMKFISNNGHHGKNEIHPFADGNGRIGRIFTNLILLKKGFPPIFITDVDRKDYLQRFELAEENPEAMLDFMADRLIESLEMKIAFSGEQR